MLFTLLNWLYILITSYICGSFVLRRLTGTKTSFFGWVRKQSCRNAPTQIPDAVMGGLAMLTAYSEYFSLFGGVGLVANLILIITCLIFIYIDREIYGNGLKLFFEIRNTDRTGRLAITITSVISVMVLLVCAYFTAASAFTYDTGTYHAQSIHWIESYGVVRGLAHMQTRLGFNNSYFALCALYSFHFLGRSMHTVSGFLAAFTMLYSVFGYAGRFIKCGKCEGGTIRLRVSDFLYIAPFAYFIITAFELTSPSTDFGVIWMIIWLMIRWVECIEDDKGGRGSSDRITVFSLLSVFSVFLVTVKLSVGVLALITLYPLVFLIREKKYGDIVKYILSGLVLVLPFFIRNYLITGWLVYPFPAIDLFNPDWKVPLEGVRHEADEVVVWARYTKDTALIDQSIREWFPVWWREQGQANRFLCMSAFAGCFAVILRIFITGSKLKEHRAYVFTGAVLVLCFVFFMSTAPSNRFGYAYILTIPLYGAGDICVNILPGIFGGKEGQTGRTGRLLCMFSGILVLTVLLAGFIKGIRMFASDDRHMALDTGISGYLIGQRDYPAALSESEVWEGINMYYPVNEGDQIWYHAFPAILYRGNLDGVELRGTSIREGFRLKKVEVDLL